MKRFLQLLSVIVILTVYFQPSIALAQQENKWTEPVDLSNSVADSVYPSLAVDPAGRVHVVWLEYSPGGSMILYTSLVNGNWTTPVDIVPDVGYGAPRLVSDEKGTLHMAYSGGGGISYAQAFAPQAGSPRAWSEPVILAPYNSNLSGFDLAVGSGAAAGTVCLTYAHMFGSDSGVFLACSHDDGLSWDQPYVVYENQAADLMVSDPHLAIGPDGSLHVVWVIGSYPYSFPALGLRYSRSTDGGLTWSAEFNLADGPYDAPKISLCAAPQVHVVWSGTTPDRYRFHRWSADDGKTWFDIWRNTAGGGALGEPDLVCDSAGNLHWLTAIDDFSLQNRINVPTDALYHAVFSNGKWFPGEIILRGVTQKQNLVSVSAGIALGNQLHVVVGKPLPLTKSTIQFDVFYTSKLLDVPALPPKVLQNANPILMPSPTFVASLTPSPSPTALSGQFATPNNTPWQAISVGALTALAVMILVLIFRFLRSRQ